MPVNVPPTLPIPKPPQQQGPNSAAILAFINQRNQQQRQSQLDELRQGQVQAQQLEALKSSALDAAKVMGAKGAIASHPDLPASFIPVVEAVGKQSDAARKATEQEQKATSQQTQNESLGRGLVFGDPRSATVDALRATEQQFPNDPAALRALTAGGAAEADKLLGDPSQLGTLQAKSNISQRADLRVSGIKESRANRRGRTLGERIDNQIESGMDLDGKPLSDSRRKRLLQRRAQLDASGDSVMTIPTPDGDITIAKGTSATRSGIQKMQEQLSDQTDVIDMATSLAEIIRQDPTLAGTSGKIRSGITSLVGSVGSVGDLFKGTVIGDTVDDMQNTLEMDILDNRADPELREKFLDAQTQGFMDVLEFSLQYALALERKRSGRINIEDLKQSRAIIGTRVIDDPERVLAKLEGLIELTTKKRKRTIRKLGERGAVVLGPNPTDADIKKAADNLILKMRNEP